MIAEKLKKAVLQAAIQGKLTEQLPSDGDARDLLQEIHAEKSCLIQEGKIRREKPLLEITEDETPFDIPENWAWCRLNDIANYKKGPFGSSLTKSMFIPDGRYSIKVYEQKNAIQKDESIGDYFITDSYYKSSMKGFSVVGGDIIISCAGTIGESFIMPYDSRVGIINQALMRVRIFSPLDNNYFLILFDYGIKTKEARGKGSAIKNIPPFKILKNIIVPLPPLDEQNRIICQLEEILPLINELKTDEIKLDELQKSFPKQMKASILQSAIQGKLTDQLPEDGDANDLVEEIKGEKERLIKEGKIKKKKPLSKITEDEIPFDIPENWCWVRLGVILKITNGFTPLRSNNNFWNSKDIPWFTIKDIRKQGRIITYTEQYISNSAINNSERIVPADSVLLCCTASVGEYALTKIDLTTNQQFNGITILDEYKAMVSPMYMFFYVQTLSSQLIAEAGKTTFPYLSTKKLANFILPLPPIAEQKRIVDRLGELVPLCNALD